MGPLESAAKIYSNAFPKDVESNQTQGGMNPSLGALTLSFSQTSLNGGEGRRNGSPDRSSTLDKPLPSLPIARTPSQFQHQRQNQLPYTSPASSACPSTSNQVPFRETGISFPQPYNVQPPPGPAFRPLSIAFPLPDNILDKHSPSSNQDNYVLHSSRTGFKDHHGSIGQNEQIKIPSFIPVQPSKPYPNPWELSLKPIDPKIVGGPTPNPTHPIVVASTGEALEAPAQGGNRQTLKQPYPLSNACSSPSTNHSRWDAKSLTPSKAGRKVAEGSRAPSSSPGPGARAGEVWVTDPSKPPAPFQCWGVKRDGTRCTRRVKVFSSSTFSPSPSSSSLSKPKSSSSAVGAGTVKQSQCKSAKEDRTKVATSRVAMDAKGRDRSSRSPSTSPTKAKSRPTLATKTKSKAKPPPNSKGRCEVIIISDSQSDGDVEDAMGKGRGEGKGKGKGKGKGTEAKKGRATEKEDEGGNDIDDVDDRNLFYGREEAYCYQHVAEVNHQKGCYLGTGPSGQMYIEFSDYLSEGEQSENCQARLRTCMTSDPTASDLGERGYVYIYELRDRSDGDHVCLKVGRAINVFKRIHQWRSQCQSKDPLLRCFLPSPPNQGLLAGTAAAEESGIVLSHKWERLIHIELMDIGHRIIEACRDCGSRHMEIFMVPRDRGGFEKVKSVVEKWMLFVKLVAGSC
ncbi:hypothetical protein IE53DRAFT_384732 [Violaceomyces palustris]|uniref:Uncharacterized protein n=1 Tax=Violaceomyces palustris TaxID=1673888 RepID=A0ACD0P3V6_9BASI|nr:hypothetical protein IE53DRAFT_384732 [Violaceomyces palustris]